MLISDLDWALLPFRQILVRDHELATAPLPTENILIVENEQCLHLLPAMKNTIAILGAGLNLAWMQAPWLKSKSVAYWGDMDSWGLTMLARARKHKPTLSALLMSQTLFEQYQKNRAVEEPSPSLNESSSTLTTEEQQFLDTLRSRKKGRLEQEFLPQEIVHSVLRKWHSTTRPGNDLS